MKNLTLIAIGVKIVKKSNRKVYIFIATLLIPIYVIIGSLVGGFIRVRNVFDEMYYAMSETRSLPFTLARYTDRSEMVYIDRKAIDEFGSFTIMYDQGFTEDAFIRLDGNIVRKDFMLAVRLGFEDYFETDGESGYYMWIQFEYYVDSKTIIALPLEVCSHEYQTDEGTSRMNRASARSFLTERGINKDKIEEWSQYYLYDKILSDWFRYNGWCSKFNMDNLGDVVMVWDQWE
jgi:hypothetical protein